MKPLTSSFAYQRGVATILIVLLVGVAMTAASLGVVHSLKGAQQKQISAHASTHAQAAAWAGVEALRVYLTGLDFNQVMALAGKDIELSFAAGAVDDVELKAKINAVPLMMDDELDLPVIITAKSLSAKSSSIIDVVYHMELDSGNNTNNDSDCENNDAAAFYDKLDITGGEIVIRDKHGNPGNLTVVGDLTVSGSANFIGGLGDVKVTGSVSIANENVYRSIKSNSFVSITAASVIDTIEAIGDVDLAGYARFVASNQSVSLTRGNTDFVSAGVDVTATDSARYDVNSTIEDAEAKYTDLTVAPGALVSEAIHDYVVAGANITFTGQARANTLIGSGDVAITSSTMQLLNGTTPSVITGEVFDCPAVWDGTGVTIKSLAANGANPCGVLGATAAEVVAPTVVEVFTEPTPEFDAYDIEVMSKANFLYRFDEVQQRIVVDVQNIKGLNATGLAKRFYLGDYDAPTINGLDNAVFDAAATAAYDAAIAAGSSEPDAVVAGDVARVSAVNESHRGRAVVVLENGTQEVIKQRGSYMNYLCEGIDAVSGANVPAICTCTEYDQAGDCSNDKPEFTLCWGGSNWGQHRCVTYDVNDKKWDVSGFSLAPGVHWFEGDVALSTVYNFGSIITTGDISTSAAMVFQAPNVSGPKPICYANLGDPEGANEQTIFSTSLSNGAIKDILGFDVNNPDDYVHQDFEGFYPTNLCSPSGADLNYSAHDVGNYALAAGSNDGGVYTGGEIDLKSNVIVWGTTLAGNNLVAADEVKLYGVVVAYGLNPAGNSNDISASVTIDLEKINSIYYGDGGLGTPPGGGSCDTGGANIMLVEPLWTRYL